jgi:hypothetical protein
MLCTRHASDKPEPESAAGGCTGCVEGAGGLEDLASIDERCVGVGCRRERDAREARRGAFPRQGQCAPSVWSDRRHIRPAGFYFLYFASPILIPTIAALLLSMLLAPFVSLLERVRVPRTLGSLILVVAAIGALFGIAVSLRGPAQSWLSEPQRFSRLEEKLRPITASFEILQYANRTAGKRQRHRGMGLPSRRWNLPGRDCRASSQLALGMWRPRSPPSSA